MADANEIISVVLGGGAVATITVLANAFKDWRAGRLATEDTAINRWKELASEREVEADKAWSIVAKYRRVYPQLWVAYMAQPGDKIPFPSDPSDPETRIERGTVYQETSGESNGQIPRGRVEPDHGQQGPEGPRTQQGERPRRS